MIGGGTGNMAIGVSIFLRDRFSAQARSVSASARQMQTDMGNMSRQQMSAARNMNAAGAMLGAGALNMMAGWVKAGAEYGYTMKYVTQLAKGSASEVAALDKRAKDLGQSSMFSTKKVAEGMRFMAMAGMNAKQVYDNIDAAVNMSISTMTELGGKGGGADILTNVMKGFSIQSQHAARVADILTLSTTSANMSLFDLGEAMKYAQSTSMDLNVGLEETASMIAMAGNAGIQGSMAGTAIENMLRYIAIAAGGDKKKANEALSQIGLSPANLKDAQGNLLPIGNILGLIGKSLDSMGNIKKQTVMQTLFGVRGKREGSLLIRNMQDYHKFLKMINEESGGLAAKNAAALMDTPQGRIQQMADTWENFKIAFTEALAPVIVPLLRALTKVLQGIIGIMSTPFGKFLTLIGVGWLAIKTATMAYRAAVLSVRLATTALGTASSTAAGQAISGWNGATAAVSRYGAAMGMAQSGGLSGMANAYGRTSRGGYYKTGAAGMGASFIGKKAYMQGKYGKVGGAIMGSSAATKIGGYAKSLKMPKLGMSGMGAGLAGAGLSMAGDAVGGDLGKGMGVLGMAAQGAGLGSLAGPWGILAGAVGGLAYGIYDWIDSSDTNTDALSENTSANKYTAGVLAGNGTVTTRLSGGSAGFWQDRLNMMDSGGAGTNKYPLTNDLLSSLSRNSGAMANGGARFPGDANKVGEAMNLTVNIGGDEVFLENNIKLLQSLQLEAGI